MIDIFLVVLFLLMLVKGYKSGFVWQVLKITRLLLMLAIVYLFGNQIALFLMPYIKPIVVNMFLQGMPSYLSDQIAIYIIRLFFPFILVFVMGRLTKQMLKLFHGKIIKNIPLVGMLNAMLGSVVAGLEAIVIFLLVVALMPVVGPEWHQYMITNSMFVRFAQEQLPAILSILQMYWS